MQNMKNNVQFVNRKILKECRVMKFFRKYNNQELAIIFKEQLKNKYDNIDIQENDYIYQVFSDYRAETGKTKEDFYMELLLVIADRFIKLNNVFCYFEN